MRMLGFLPLVTMVMCGGKTDGVSDPQTPADQLSTDQLKALCDWQATLFGGYGRWVSCEAGVVDGGDPGFSNQYYGPTDQASCVTNLSGQYQKCPTPLAQVKECLQWSVTYYCGPTVPTPAACTTFLSAQCGG
jgi:hypothetical protein